MTTKKWVDYHSEVDDVSRAAPDLAADFVQPSEVDMRRSRSDINAFLSGGEARIVIPMREQRPTVTHLLDALAEQGAAGAVTVVDDGSSEDVLAKVREYGARVYDKERVLDLLDWERLLPILDLEERPSGKGTAVLAGYLVSYLQGRQSGQPSWILQHDADVVEYSRSRGLDYLAYGVVNAPGDIEHVKLAQPGRGNEWCMSTRNSLQVLSQLQNMEDSVAAKLVARRAGEINRRLASYKWMLSGQFGLSWELAMNRPFASGYLEETLVCMYAEDLADGKQWTKQVESPVKLADGMNDYAKEYGILQLVSNFLVTLVLIGRDVNSWTLADIESINRRFMRVPAWAALIPPGPGPVENQLLPSERVLPSVRMLDEAGLIRSGAEEMVQSL